MTINDLLFGTQLIEILQRLLAPTFNRIFEAITLLGNDAVLVAFTAVVYWCFDKRKGRLVTYILFLGAYLNFLLKGIIPWPRPPVNLRITEKAEMSNGFPSGNAQDATTFWTWISLDFKKRLLAVLGTLVALAVGISRIYLGVHYPAQVIGGWLTGFGFAGIGFLAVQRLPRKDDRIHLIPQVTFSIATLIPLAFAVQLGAVGEINPGLVAGYLFVFPLGAIIEDRYVQFNTQVGTAKRIIRIIVGGAVLGALTIAMNPILPQTALITAFANSSILGLTVVLIVPTIFKIIERK